ncbi:MAG: hypothetical protein G01um101425_894 [Candidatus Peregrinibacteria bacterium Gr01-1014_25]|nr:MAG: hypothetical protein G01um101425_894 [Candidatus Peregrinibacteria bacterium Gr01-1014_25]
MLRLTTDAGKRSKNFLYGLDIVHSYIGTSRSLGKFAVATVDEEMVCTAKSEEEARTGAHARHIPDIHGIGHQESRKIGACQKFCCRGTHG